MLLLGYRQLGTQDSKGERTYWNVSGKVLISGTKNGIGRGCKIFISGQCIIGGWLCITGNSTIVCRKKISFGNNVLISWDVLIMDTDHHTINDAEGNILNYDKPIVFGDDIWIGCRTTILKGSTVPSNSIVAAGSIVSGKLQKEGCIYTSGGKILKDNISWKR